VDVIDDANRPGFAGARRKTVQVAPSLAKTKLKI
jgi:hypothetical protein